MPDSRARSTHIALVPATTYNRYQQCLLVSFRQDSGANSVSAPATCHIHVWSNWSQRWSSFDYPLKATSVFPTRPAEVLRSTQGLPRRGHSSTRTLGIRTVGPRRRVGRARAISHQRAQARSETHFADCFRSKVWNVGFSLLINTAWLGMDLCDFRCTPKKGLDHGCA